MLFEKPQQVAGKTGGLKRPSLATDSIVKQPDKFFVARMERSEIREAAIPDCAALHPGYGSPDARHRPVFGPAPGLAGLPVPCSPPRRGVRNDRAFHRARGARMCWHTGSPHAAFAAHGQWPSPTPKIVGLNRAVEADLRLRSARGWILRLAACPRGCRWRRRAPVRASCRPDMHLDRPPVLPASVPVRFLGICDPHCVQGPAS